MGRPPPGRAMAVAAAARSSGAGSARSAMTRLRAPAGSRSANVRSAEARIGLGAASSSTSAASVTRHARPAARLDLAERRHRDREGRRIARAQRRVEHAHRSTLSAARPCAATTTVSGRARAGRRRSICRRSPTRASAAAALASATRSDSGRASQCARRPTWRSRRRVHVARDAQSASLRRPWMKRRGNASSSGSSRRRSSPSEHKRWSRAKTQRKCATPSCRRGRAAARDRVNLRHAPKNLCSSRRASPPSPSR